MVAARGAADRPMRQPRRLASPATYDPARHAPQAYRPPQCRFATAAECCRGGRYCGRAGAVAGPAGHCTHSPAGGDGRAAWHSMGGVRAARHPPPAVASAQGGRKAATLAPLPGQFRGPAHRPHGEPRAVQRGLGAPILRPGR